MRDRAATVPVRRRVAGLALPVVVMMLASACLAVSDAGSSAGGEGVSAGATKPEYQRVFGGVEPIELTLQSPSSPGVGGSVHIEAYADALREWSGGKLDVEIAYANAIAGPDDAPSALADGRVDMDYLYPLYEPSRFPANGALAKASLLGEHGPVAGTLQALGAYLETGMSTPEISDELSYEGIRMLLPYGPTTSLALMCTEPRDSLAELQGAQVRVSGSAHAVQAEALGMSPVSLPYSEIYEALQRGTIDCAMGNGWSNGPLGIVPLAPHYTIDADTGFARLPFAIGFGQAEWESLPLVARQLIHDRLDVYIERMLSDYIWPAMQEAAGQMAEHGGEFNDFASDVERPLRETNRELLDDVRNSKALDGERFLNDVNAALEKWKGIVEEMSIPAVPDAEFAGWYREGRIDLDGFMERIRSEVLHAHRPR
ncbi:hypothetical protein GCM10009676_34040 [Prauserella halophila]|uniref:TRAP-type C4-dicarboxylate transport system substrate-binding protein n=1 Tax=Prauserella halophila TaxID=185641 RepID=A0ABN1WF99_9PSEU|nr:hypothetical protein [Prauserella halophila]MCP2237115.1 TRAP-type C4-dicarboxylate transport system, substrate-binding protein [Prauserella halophila]